MSRLLKGYGDVAGTRAGTRRGAECVVEQIVDVPVLRFMEEIVEVVAGDLVCNF